jgi:hypothetical protein
MVNDRRVSGRGYLFGGIENYRDEGRMIGYLILVGIFLFIAFIFWMRQTVKKTIVYPVDLMTRKVKDPLLSEKSRFKVFREENGIAIGFGLCLVVVATATALCGGGN